MMIFADSALILFAGDLGLLNGTQEEGIVVHPEEEQGIMVHPKEQQGILVHPKEGNYMYVSMEKQVAYSGGFLASIETPFVNDRLAS
jgi:hypothetical protein